MSDRRRPYLIGVAGGSNSGKTTIAERLEEVKREQAMEQVLADQALRDFEVQMGIVTPETGKVGEAAKELGPATATKEKTMQK